MSRVAAVKRTLSCSESSPSDSRCHFSFERRAVRLPNSVQGPPGRSFTLAAGMPGVLGRAPCTDLPIEAPGLSELSVLSAVWRTLKQRRAGVFAPLWAPHNVKVLAYELARMRAQQPPLQNACSEPPPSQHLSSSVCSGRDWASAWLPYWAHRIGMQPAFHRKLWEFAFISQVLSDASVLGRGKRGLGFGCGKEPLASLFAGLGSDVLATDLQAEDERAQAWSHGQQHSSSIANVWMPNLCSAEDARARLRFRPIDMNHIPDDLVHGFDFCWSSCALEHLGSIEQGLTFIRAAARCLCAGGVAVHTTELNLDPGETLARGPTVLSQPQHFDLLAAALADDGIEFMPISFGEADPFLDGYIDVPPYPEPTSVGSTLQVLHLRLLIGSFRTTSVGLVMRARGA